VFCCPELKETSIMWSLSSEDLDHAVDLEAIKERLTIPSETTATRETFRETVRERDACCIFSGATGIECEGTHIIPYIRGSDVWMRNTIALGV
jgi:hypothetical protein